MKIKFKIYFLVILPIFLVGEVHSKTSEKPKSIILFIGDGMGVAQVTTAIMNNVGSNFMRRPSSSISIIPPNRCEPGPVANNGIELPE